MLTRRLIVCLDVRDARVVKGTRFESLRDVGDPVELAEHYEAGGADEIVFLDISASPDERATLLDIVRRTAARLFIPLTVGGGIRSVDDVARALQAGADKVSINSAAVARPELITECATRYGAQCVVASIDARREGDAWLVRTRGGRSGTTLDAVEWARECAARGAGEILLTSIDRDGVRGGYDLELTRAVARVVGVPVVASGGAGSPEHVVAAFREGDADAALVAGIVHDGVTTVGGLKRAMHDAGISVRAMVATERRGQVFNFERAQPLAKQRLSPLEIKDLTPPLLMEAATEVARLTGDIALRHFRTALAVESKADGSPVTIADREAERAARDWLEARFPHDGILGEELGTTRPDAARRWVIDPIDGTKTFVRGVPLWGTLVAAVEGDRVVAGAAYFPAIDELLCAAPGAGAWWNGVRCSVSRVSSISEATVLTTDERFPHSASQREAWIRLASRARMSRSWGDCYGYLLVATGRAESMVDGVLAAWDAAPFLPIIEEAGGVLTDWAGRRTAFGGSAIASNAALATATRELLGAGAPPVTVASNTASSTGSNIVSGVAHNTAPMESLND